MVNDTTAVASPADAACEDARKDGDAIRNAFATKGIEEAYALLKEERKNAGTLSPIEKDIWEKELVNALSANGGKTDILPGLSLAYLKENKSTFTNPDDGDEYDVRSVNGEARKNCSTSARWKMITPVATKIYLKTKQMTLMSFY